MIPLPQFLLGLILSMIGGLYLGVGIFGGMAVDGSESVRALLFGAKFLDWEELAVAITEARKTSEVQHGRT